MLYREIIAVCSEINIKHINTLCGQNVELLNVKLVVHIVTAGLWSYLYWDMIDGYSCQYSHAPHNDVSVNDGPHIRQWSRNIIILLAN